MAQQTQFVDLLIACLELSKAPYKCNHCKVTSKTLGDLRMQNKTKHSKQNRPVKHNREVLRSTTATDVSAETHENEDGENLHRI